MAQDKELIAIHEIYQEAVRQADDVRTEATALASKAYHEAIALLWEAFYKMVEQAEKAYREAINHHKDGGERRGNGNSSSQR